MPSLEQLLAQVGSHRDEMVEALSEMIRIPAIGPESGGSGELERSRYLRDILDHSKFDDVEMYDALGSTSLLFSFAKRAGLRDQAFVEESQNWFDALWATITTDLTLS